MCMSDYIWILTHNLEKNLVMYSSLSGYSLKSFYPKLDEYINKSDTLIFCWECFGDYLQRKVIYMLI